MTNSDVGKLGEDFTASYYSNHGYNVTARNYHSRYGEIDLIAENELYLVFIEVKTRSSSFSSPREAVDRSKQKKIILTAMQYMQENLADKQPRFDVFEVIQKGGRVNNFNLLENSFDLTDCGDNYGLF
ncbi:MAG: YraN family protein [Ruminococcus sp.]|nr:YraN family protein [Ruminococcus sp.]